MTRINLTAVSSLNNKHLMGEIHEITRVFNLVRKRQSQGVNRYNFKEKVKPPVEFTMGTGHVKFFYDKLQFITRRYYELTNEALDRGYNVNPIDKQSLVDGIHHWWFNDYIPDDKALSISQARINERLLAMEEST